MCIHDTCEVGPKMEEKFHTYMKLLKAHPYLRNRTDKPIQILKPKFVASNIAILHREIIKQFAPNVSLVTTKAMAVHMEFGTHPSSLYHPSVQQKIPIVMLPPRIETGKLDVYQTGHKRGVFYYSCFDLTKYIFLGQEGDIVNSIKNIDMDKNIKILCK